MKEQEVRRQQGSSLSSKRDVVDVVSTKPMMVNNDDDDVLITSAKGLAVAHTTRGEVGNSSTASSSEFYAMQYEYDRSKTG